MHKHLWQLGGRVHDHWAITGIGEKGAGYYSKNETFYLFDCQISPLLVLFFSQCLQEAQIIFTCFAHWRTLFPLIPSRLLLQQTISKFLTTQSNYWL